MSKKFCLFGKFSKKRVHVQHISSENLHNMWGVPEDDLENEFHILFFSAFLSFSKQDECIAQTNKKNT